MDASVKVRWQQIQWKNIHINIKRIKVNNHLALTELNDGFFYYMMFGIDRKLHKT